MGQNLTTEEKLFKLCRNEKAKISRFTTLLEGGSVRLNIHDEEGNHPLWYVSYHGRSDLVNLLLQHNAEVDLATIDEFGETALITASHCGHLETTKLLIQQGAVVNYPSKNGATALCLASRNNHANIVQLLLENGAQIKGTIYPPLYDASVKGNLNVVQILLDHGADVNQPCKVKPYHSPLIAATRDDKYIQVVQLLIDRGANIDYQDYYGDTALHWAAKGGHFEVVKLLVQSQANRNIKNNDGQTPIKVVKKKKYQYMYMYSDIIALLKTGVRALGSGRVVASVSHSVEEVEPSVEGDKTDHHSQPGSMVASIGDSEMKVEPSVEEDNEIDHHSQPGSDSMVTSVSDGDEEVKPSVEEDDETDCHFQPDMPPLTAVPKEGYVCVAQNSLCLVYLPQEIKEILFTETVTDTSFHPRIASNEIKITPVVRITSKNTSLSLEKPAIIELIKSIELSDKETNNKVFPLCANSESSEWKELGLQCNCKVLYDRISFQVTHFSLFAVISRKPYPSSTVGVKPVLADTPAPDRSSTPTELTIPELPGFKVQITPSGIIADRETDITATVLYDTPAVCSEDDRSRLASSCIELDPRGITFSKAASISIPIPKYAEVKENHPNARLQIWHTDSLKLDWKLIEHSISQDNKGRYVAIVSTESFSRHIYKSLWDVPYTSETPLFYIPFGIKERCQVFMPQKHESIAGSFINSGRQRKLFTIEPDRQIELREGFHIGEISVGVKENTYYTQTLMKPVDETSTLSQVAFFPSTTTADQFEENIMTIEDAAEKLGEDITRFEDNSGPMMEAAKKIANMWMKMAELINEETWSITTTLTFKENIVDLAKRIIKESQEIVRIATSTAEACTDKIMKKEVYAVVGRIGTISHQLRHLATRETKRQRDEASDLEACQLLTTNATNLTLAISDVLYCTQSASLRVTMATRKELGLTHMETDPITGKQSQYHKSSDNQREHQGSDEGSGSHSQGVSSSTEKRVKIEVKDTDTTKSTSAPTFDPHTWKLRGVEECGETSVVVYSSQGQLVEWNGLKLHIHQGSLPECLQKCMIYIKASLTGEYEIPENSCLVSAIFWLRCEPQCTFTKPITVEIQHCSTKQDPSRLKIVRAFCSQKRLPYNFKPLGGRFDAGTSYGAVEVNGFSGYGVAEESPVSERLYYSQLFYRSYHSHRQRHEVHIIFTWNTEAHVNYVNQKYPMNVFFAGVYQVIQLVGDVIRVSLGAAKWTKVMDGQWEIQPAKPKVTKTELDDFKTGRGIPICMLEARPLCEQFPQLLHQITLEGIKPPHDELILSYMPSSIKESNDALQPQIFDTQRLPSKQQSTSSCVATSTTTQHQLSTSAMGQQNQTKLDKLPSLDQLMILKYIAEGVKKKVRIISEASHKWKNIANLICGDINITVIMEQKCHGDPEECLKQTFIDYFISKRPQGYSQDWNGLIELLDDVSLETLAENVKQALSCIT